jgi:hypothetical protein
MLEFFEALSKTGLIAMVPQRDYSGKDQNIFFIQIPKIEAAENAFEIIKSNVAYIHSSHVADLCLGFKV